MGIIVFMLVACVSLYIWNGYENWKLSRNGDDCGEEAAKPRKVDVERVIAAAYRRNEPSVPPEQALNYKDPSCWERYGKYDDIYTLEIGRRHNDILVRFKGLLDVNSGGFYTSFGRYVDRKEAYTIALKAGQIKKDETTHSDWLFTEDLW